MKEKRGDLRDNNFNCHRRIASHLFDHPNHSIDLDLDEG